LKRDLTAELRLANISICFAEWVTHAEIRTIIEYAPFEMKCDMPHNKSKEKKWSLECEAYCIWNEGQQDIAAWGLFACPVDLTRISLIAGQSIDLILH
jgi:hypothetical protein